MKSVNKKTNLVLWLAAGALFFVLPMNKVAYGLAVAAESGKTEAVTEIKSGAVTEEKPEAAAEDQPEEGVSKGYDTGWYVGLAVNADKKLGAEIDAGYQFNHFFALEGSYGYLSSEVQESIPMMSLRAVGSYRINDDFTLLGRVGVASLKATQKCLLAFASCYSNFDGKVYEKDYVAPTVGLGIEYEAFEDFGVRLSYDRYQFGKDKRDVNQLGLAVVKRF